MKFTIVLTGIVLLIVGLLAYSSIPNIHNVPIQTSLSVIAPTAISVDAGFLSETPPENVSILPGKQNEFRINITVSLATGEPSSIQFKLFTKDRSPYCMSGDQPSGCLVNRSVSNETLRVPLNASNTYYLAFDNTGSASPKKVILSASLFTSSVQTIVTKDGSFNFAGLGLGALGFLVVLYGASRKAVIPWE